MPRCKARNRAGNQCGRDATPGMEVCNLHGGKSLKGIACPNLKTGRYSKYLPARLLDRYQQAEADPELLNLKAEISLIDSRLADLLGRVDSGESGRIWSYLTELTKEMERGRAAGDKQAVAIALNALTSAIKQGQSDYAAWGEIHSVINQRCRLVESERKRMVEMQQYVTAEQSMLLITAVADSVRRHVKDKSALAAIASDLARFTSFDAGRVADTKQQSA